MGSGRDEYLGSTGYLSGQIDLGDGDDIAIGGSESETFIGGLGNDIMDGGDGIDYAVFNVSAFSDLTIVENADGSYTVTANTGSDGTDTLRNIEFIRIGNEDFRIIPAEPGVIDGTDRADTLSGTDGDDIINGLRGNDSLFGGLGNDLLEGGGGRDILDGGAGIDTATYINSNNGVIVNMAGGTAASGHATGDTLISIENLIGSNFNDTLTGNRSDNVITGGNGFDVLGGFIGDDTIYGGAGNDFILGGAGADIIDGGAGEDYSRYVGSNAAVFINLEEGTATGGHAEGDVLIGIERLFGSSFDDTLIGDAENNWLFGANGDDTLDGGAGLDKMFGGAGSDTFVFSAGDDVLYVTDFQDDIDSIDLSSYGFATLGDALANMNQLGSHVRFFADGDTLLILNTDLADIEDDIIIDNGGMV